MPAPKKKTPPPPSSPHPHPLGPKDLKADTKPVIDTPAPGLEPDKPSR